MFRDCTYIASYGCHISHRCYQANPLIAAIMSDKPTAMPNDALYPRCVLQRPSATELMYHPWMLEFREALLHYEEAEMATNPPAEMPSEEVFESASVARQAAIIQEKEVEAIMIMSPSMSPVETPISRDPLLFETHDISQTPS